MHTDTRVSQQPKYLNQPPVIVHIPLKAKPQGNPSPTSLGKKPLPAIPTKGFQKDPPVNQDIAQSAQNQLTQASSTQGPTSQIRSEVNFSPNVNEQKAQAVWCNSKGNSPDKGRQPPNMFGYLGQENVAPNNNKPNNHNGVQEPSRLDSSPLTFTNDGDSNSSDSHGNTPLHEAAECGNYKSAARLIEEGARAYVPNANGDFPFDLAIRYGHADFIHFFLQTARRLPMQALNGEDVEGYHSRLLLAAKKEGLVEEQIFHIQAISAFYIEKKNDFPNGLKLLNCALALLCKLPNFNNFEMYKEYLFARLDQVEVMYLKSIGLKRPAYQPQTSSIVSYRNQLKAVREEARTAQEDMQKITRTVQENKHKIERNAEQNVERVRILLKGMTVGFRRILSELIRDAMIIVGHLPPTVRAWACMGMGSMSRLEMFPRSDVEFAFIFKIEKKIEDKAKAEREVTEYFRKVSKILELRIINLGETKYPLFEGYEDSSPTPGGFSMDSAGNTPLGVPGIYELIGTKETLLQFQSEKWMDNNIILANALNHVCCVTGSSEIKKLKLLGTKTSITKGEHLVIQYEREKSHRVKNHKELSRRLLEGHIREYKPSFSSENMAVGIKQQLYRPFQEIIGTLSYLHLSSYAVGAFNDIFSRIETLFSPHFVFSMDGADALKIAVAKVYALRLKAHLFYENEIEIIHHLEMGKPRDPNRLYFDEESLTDLREIYQVLKPFHKCSVEFQKSGSKSVFKNSKFFEPVQDSLYASSKEELEEILSLNPNDELARKILASPQAIQKIEQEKREQDKKLKELNDHLYWNNQERRQIAMHFQPRI